MFIDDTLIPLRRDFPELRIVFEHITTREAAQYVQRGRPLRRARRSPRITCSTTATRSSSAASGRTGTACRCSSAKRTGWRWSPRPPRAATKFFLGTDSAPHPAHLKEHATGCAGCYTALAALELYAEAFDAAGALDRLEAFASFNGPAFYGLPRNTGTVTLRREAVDAARDRCPSARPQLKPLRGGETLNWRLA